MKIAIAGAHGVGKTTLAKALAKKLKINYIPDIVREEAVKKGFAINENTPPEVHLWLTLRQWELEKTTPEDWIADKSLLDYLVYGELVLKESLFKRVVKRVVENNFKYDFVFYLPIEFSMEKDGIRSANLKFQKIVDFSYKKNLSRLNIKYYSLAGSVEDRITGALEIMKVNRI